MHIYTQIIDIVRERYLMTSGLFSCQISKTDN